MKFNILLVVFSFMAVINKTGCSLKVLFLSTVHSFFACSDGDYFLQGPVVRTPVSANPGLNFNQGFFFFS